MFLKHVDTFLDRVRHVHTGDALDRAFLHHPRDLLLDHLCRNAHGYGVIRHRIEHHRVGANLRVISDRDRAEDLRARTDDHMVSERRMALALFFSGPAERDSLVKDALLAHLGRLADYDAHTVIDKEPRAYLRRGMDLDAGAETCDVGKEARDHRYLHVPEEMVHPVQEYGMEPGIGKDHFQSVPRCRIVPEDRPVVALDGTPKAHN
jgi:hypothetical protein